MRRLLFIPYLQTALLGLGASALPITYVPNVGQTDPAVRYFVQTPELRVAFTDHGAVFQIG